MKTQKVTVLHYQVPSDHPRIKEAQKHRKSMWAAAWNVVVEALSHVQGAVADKVCEELTAELDQLFLSGAVRISEYESQAKSREHERRWFFNFEIHWPGDGTWEEHAEELRRTHDTIVRLR